MGMRSQQHARVGHVHEHRAHSAIREMHAGKANPSHHRLLLGMTGLSFVSMYLLMYAMVNSSSNVYNSLNQLYMAGLMTTPMVVFELVLMRSMYRNAMLNRLIVGAALAAGVACLVVIRAQAAISDREFLRAMNPHHAGAILMCSRAPIQDAYIRALCRSILAGQEAEIDQMKAKLQA